LAWNARTPHGTTVRFEIRAAANRENLEQATWRGAKGGPGWYDESDMELNLAQDCRWVQYRVALQTRDGGSTPVLEEIRIDVK
jgi:hypothetical protein